MRRIDLHDGQMGEVTVANSILRELRRKRWEKRGELLGWAATVLAITGVVLNNCRLWPCFVFWIASNAMSAYIHGRAGMRSLLVRDLVFLVLAGVGLWQWCR